MKALDKKIATELWELELERTKAEAELTLKHSVFTKGLKSQYKKENQLVKGELKSRIDLASSSRSILSPSKNRLFSASSCSKLLPTLTR